LFLFLSTNYLQILLPTTIMKKHSKRTKAKHDWRPKEIKLLGKLSDAELARRIGIRTAVVSKKRASMGIDPSSLSKRLKWTPKNLALLGKRTDSEVARIMKGSSGRVAAKRLSLGIECYATSSNSWHTWTNKEIAMLGKYHDPEVGRKIGISIACVARKRRQLGIASLLARKTTIRDPRSLDQWTAKETALLGKMTDKDVTERLDIAISAVRLKRISLGIAPYRRRVNFPGIWTPAVMARIPNESSAKLARELGVSRQRVHQKRKELLEG
jgi:hypothetical protein